MADQFLGPAPTVMMQRDWIPPVVETTGESDD